MPLLLDGKFAIPLYHGTNILFCDSIRQYGLGGRNVIKELRVIELLRELLAICEKSLPTEEDWIPRMDCVNWVASQAVTEGGFNWRHGSAYLSASVDKAVRYAVSSEFSSEALAHFMMLWRRLNESRIVLPPSVEVDSQPIIQFASGIKVPLVLQLDGVPISALSSEIGGDPNKYLNFLEPLASEDPSVFQALLQGANFELREPVCISEEKIFRVLKDSPGESGGLADEYSLVHYHAESTHGALNDEVVFRVRLP
jgi:hypothetical protein